MINARAETIAERPVFREPLESRRCLIPADGFYEWTKKGSAKSPFCFTLLDDSVFAFAGIWDRWRNPEKELVETCSIITTSANALFTNIHDRMPVIMEPENYDLWLDPGFRRAGDLLDLLKPYRADSMRRYRVSTRVNSVENDDPACAEEYSPLIVVLGATPTDGFRATGHPGVSGFWSLGCGLPASALCEVSGTPAPAVPKQVASPYRPVWPVGWATPRRIVERR